MPFAPPPLYDEQRAAEAAAYLLHLARAPLTVLGLTKLLYLAERESYLRFAEPLTGDAMVSMRHGPVLSITYDRSKGAAEPGADCWSRLITDRQGNLLDLRDRGALNDEARALGSMSPADLELLRDVWAKFGALATPEPWALVKWCHVHCHEWEDPGNSSTLIPLRRLLFAVHGDEDVVRAIAEQIDERAGIERAFRD